MENVIDKFIWCEMWAAPQVIILGESLVHSGGDLVKIVEFFIKSVWRNKFKKIRCSGIDGRGSCEDSGDRAW